MCIQTYMCVCSVCVQCVGAHIHMYMYYLRINFHSRFFLYLLPHWEGLHHHSSVVFCVVQVSGDPRPSMGTASSMTCTKLLKYSITNTGQNL